MRFVLACFARLVGGGNAVFCVCILGHDRFLPDAEILSVVSCLWCLCDVVIPCFAWILPFCLLGYIRTTSVFCVVFFVSCLSVTREFMVWQPSATRFLWTILLDAISDNSCLSCCVMVSNRFHVPMK